MNQRFRLAFSVGAVVLVVLLLGYAFYGPTLFTTPAAPRDSTAAGTPDSAALEEPPRSVLARRRTLRADRLARRLIARADSAFRATEPLSAAEKSRLRRFLNPEHLARARRLGVDPVRDRRAAAALRFQPTEESGLVRIRTGDFYILDPSMGYAVPLVVPSAAHLLGRIGRRFQRRLLGEGLPPYRFVLTNVLRTGVDQAALQGTNVNAAQGTSTHEYGTTFDVFYEWFQYAAVHDTLALQAARRSDVDARQLRRRLHDAYARFGKARARKIKAVLGRALIELQDEGALLAIYERQEPVFHLTVARELEALPADTTGDS